MSARQANAEWRGDLQDGEGTIEFGGGRFSESYNANSRFGNGEETNPEELIAGAHAACFSMALAKLLADAGHTPELVQTEAKVHLNKGEDGFAITRIDLQTKAKVPDLEDGIFQEHAEEAKDTCPVSKALSGCEIRLDARLV